MYQINEKGKKELSLITNRKYANILGITESYMSTVLNGSRPCSENLAKSLISIRFQIALGNEEIDEQLSRLFENTREEVK